MVLRKHYFWVRNYQSNPKFSKKIEKIRTFEWASWKKTNEFYAISKIAGKINSAKPLESNIIKTLFLRCQQISSVPKIISICKTLNVKIGLIHKDIYQRLIENQ